MRDQRGHNPPRFRTRLILLLVGLLVAALGVTTAAVLTTSAASIEEQAREELAVGGRVFQSLVAAREEQLLDNAELLADDFGFREAVASGDAPTIASALRNHGGRIGADAAMVASVDGDMIADAEGERDARFPFPQLLERAEAQGKAAGIVVLDNRPVQLVLVPVRAPQHVAWTALGFELDAPLARHLADVTGLEVSFAIASGNGEPYLASTLPQGARQALTNALTGTSPLSKQGDMLPLGSGDWFTLTQDLGLDNNVIAILQGSVAAAMATYHELRNQLLVIASAALLATLLAGTLFARRLTRPVNALAEAAARMAAGDYSTAVAKQRDAEFRQVADAFDGMQSAIAQRESQILHQARHDPLTGLPNRGHALDLLQGHTSGARPDQELLVVVFRIADFRSINDQLGQSIGDAVLQEVARRIEAVGDPVLFGSRLGNREFLLTIDGDTRSWDEERLRGLLRTLGAPMHLRGVQVQMSLQGGLARCPEHGDDAAMLLRCAELGLTRARAADTALASYQPGDDEAHRRRLALIAALPGAAEAGHLHALFQPQIALEDGRLLGLEALMRWEDPTLGRVPPDEFIPLAEQSGHVGTLTRWMLDQALGQCGQWRRAGRDLHVSVNLSARDLGDAGLLQAVVRSLAAHDVPAAALVLEVTETTLTHDPATAEATLRALRDLGVRLAIDDFGTGYAFLGQLKRLPVHELKIDREFVMELNNADIAIVRSSVELGHRLGLRVVAEGVENAEIQEALRGFGCDIGQGYGIARPMAADALNTWMAERDGNADPRPESGVAESVKCPGRRAGRTAVFNNTRRTRYGRMGEARRPRAGADRMQRYGDRRRPVAGDRRADATGRERRRGHRALGCAGRLRHRGAGRRDGVHHPRQSGGLPAQRRRRGSDVRQPPGAVRGAAGVES